MKELLLVEKSSIEIKPTSDPYTLEGMFTQLDHENRNGRVYTESMFMPHLVELQKVVEANKCVGELDHPKVFETSLKNASHKIEKIWYDKNEGKVFGKIKLLDTDAGKNAKALVDAGIPLHISSRAAGTVGENKEVTMHKLFSYDLVADPGFENAVLGACNESYGLDSPKSNNFFVYEVEESKNHTPYKTVNTATGPINMDGFVSKEDLNGFSEATKVQLESFESELTKLKVIQEAITVQTSEIADNINSGNDINEAIESLKSKILAIEKWSDHVVESYKTLENPDNTELLNRLNVLESKLSIVENWSEHVTETVTGIEKWSNEVTETVTGIEKWSNEVTETVTGIEDWSEHVTETVNSVEDSIKLINENVVSIGKTEKTLEKVDESLNETYATALYNKIDNIISEAKKQKAEKDKLLIEEADKAKATKLEEQPIWMNSIPEKYGELWEALSDVKKSSISKRANICEFKSEKSIKEFWDATFTGTTLEMIKESSTIKESVQTEELVNERRQRIIDAHARSFK